MCLRKPQVVLAKKRKLKDGTTKNVTGKIGTRAEHFIAFLNTLMDIMDRNSMDGRYLVMDNASIHHTKEVKDAVEKRGYAVIYLPPYSPFLNPIEEFWSKLKAGVKRDQLTKFDRLTPRIIHSAGQITPSDCQGWINHSLTFFPRCLAEEQKL